MTMNSFTAKYKEEDIKIDLLKVKKSTSLYARREFYRIQNRKLMSSA
jgi:hypothetical protein